MMRRRFTVAFFVIALPAFAQQDPDVERGYRPGRSYQTAGAVDSTNLFNGTLNLAIPLGQTYVVGGTLSYVLSARYATNAWDTGHHEIETEGRFLNFDYTFPWKHGNAGHSWIVTLGKIEIGPDDPVYIGPDGTQHRFYLTLHGSNPAEQPISGFRYTRDGSYLRLRVISGGYELHFPNGHKHTFNAAGLLTQMQDPFANYVSVAYSDQNQGDPFPGSKLWTITDSTPRTHKIYFRPGPEYDEGDFGVELPHQIVHRVDLAAFGGATAQYVFSYENENGGFSQVSRRCARINDADMQVVNAPLLAGISLSGMLQYSMEYAKGDQVNCSPTLFGTTTANFASGNVTKVTLPTGGWIEWTYRRYLFPGTGGGVVHNAGVATRTVKKDANTILAQTTYEPATVPIDSVFYDVVRTVREKDALYHTRHYFGACRVVASPSSCRAGGLYGLPGTITDIQDGAHLAVAVYEGTSTTPARRIYRRYEGDYYLKDVGQGEFNQRLASEKTVYEDDSSSTTTFTDFDGLV